MSGRGSLWRARQVCENRTSRPIAAWLSRRSWLCSRWISQRRYRDRGDGRSALPCRPLLLLDDLAAKADALVADVDARPSDQPAYFALRLPTKRAAQRAIDPLRGWRALEHEPSVFPLKQTHVPLGEGGVVEHSAVRGPSVDLSGCEAPCSAGRNLQPRAGPGAGGVRLWRRPAHRPAPPGRWVRFRHLAGVVDIAGPRGDGSFAVAAGGRLFVWSQAGVLKPFARGPGGYVTATGPEPYITIAGNDRVAETGCSFRAGTIFALQPRGRPGIIAIGPGGRAGRFASLPRTLTPTGITFDTTGHFGHALLVAARGRAATAVLAIGCTGRARAITAHAPAIEGGIAVAPASFGRYGGDLVAAGEASGRIFAVAPDGAVVTLAASGLPSGAISAWRPPASCRPGSWAATLPTSPTATPGVTGTQGRTASCACPAPNSSRQASGPGPAGRDRGQRPHHRGALRPQLHRAIHRRRPGYHPRRGAHRIHRPRPVTAGRPGGSSSMIMHDQGASEMHAMPPSVRGQQWGSLGGSRLARAAGRGLPAIVRPMRRLNGSD
jgi:hypothetical protein